jgi:hypothetical protein
MELFLVLVTAIFALHGQLDLKLRAWWKPVAGAGILLALFLVLEPESRALLLLTDYLGVDLIVMMMAVYLRHHLAIAVALVFIPLLRLAYRWGPVPGFWPHSKVLRSSVAWTAYAVIYPLWFTAFGAVCLVCLVRPWVP